MLASLKRFARMRATFSTKSRFSPANENAIRKRLLMRCVHWTRCWPRESYFCQFGDREKQGKTERYPASNRIPGYSVSVHERRLKRVQVSPDTPGRVHNENRRDQRLLREDGRVVLFCQDVLEDSAACGRAVASG